MPVAGQLQIRLAQRDDATKIATVLHKSFAEFKPLYTDQGFAATALSAEQVLLRMREGPVWVTILETEVVGTAAALIKSGSVYIRGMAVLPAARGWGAGTRLLQQVESWANAQGYSRLFLSTTPFLTSAIRLYERFGFRRSDDNLHDLFGTPLFRMEKAILNR